MLIRVVPRLTARVTSVSQLCATLDPRLWNGEGLGARQGNGVVVRRRPRARSGDRSSPPSSPIWVRDEEGSRSGIAFVGVGFGHWDRRCSQSHPTVSGFLTDWLETNRPRIRETTWVSYEMAANRITRQIGAMPLQALTPLQVESLYSTLLANGGAGGRPLAPKTVRNCHIVLRRALADAERLGLVSRNPAASARAVAAPRAEQGTWSSEEIQRFFEALAGERLSMAFVLLATTGMRRGEVLGLRWEDIDFDNRSLSIVQTLTTVRGERHIGPPKTGKSRRRVSVDKVTLDALKSHRKRQRVERIAAADVWSNEGDLVDSSDSTLCCLPTFVDI